MASIVAQDGLKTPQNREYNHLSSVEGEDPFSYKNLNQYRTEEAS
jgi:hypothetical protein